MPFISFLIKKRLDLTNNCSSFIVQNVPMCGEWAGGGRGEDGGVGWRGEGRGWGRGLERGGARMDPM